MEPTLASGRRQRGLAATGVSASTATLRRVNVDNDACVSAIPTRLAKGNVARDEDDPDGVVLGRGLARSLDLAVGGELTVLSQADDGVIVNDLYAVPGILQNASDDRTAPRSVEHHGFRTVLHAPANRPHRHPHDAFDGTADEEEPYQCNKAISVASYLPRVRAGGIRPRL